VKTCITCRRELPLGAFGRHARHRDGLNNICRECAADRQRAFRSTEHGRAVANAANRRSKARRRGSPPPAL
jgi:hypothetical protein